MPDKNKGQHSASARKPAPPSVGSPVSPRKASVQGQTSNATQGQIYLLFGLFSGLASIGQYVVALFPEWRVLIAILSAYGLIVGAIGYVVMKGKHTQRRFTYRQQVLMLSLFIITSGVFVLFSTRHVLSQTSISGLFNAGSMSSSMVSGPAEGSHTGLPKTVPQAVSDAVEINYLRLFGGIRVPVLFLYRYDSSIARGKYELALFKFDQTFQAWQDSVFHDARVLREPVWKDIKALYTHSQQELVKNYNDPTAPLPLFDFVFGEKSKVMRKLLNDYCHAMEEYYLSMEGENSKPAKAHRLGRFYDAKASRLQDQYEENEERIGFLYLVLTWKDDLKSSEPITLYYKASRERLLGTRVFLKQVDEEIAASPESHMVIPVPDRRDEKQLILLGAYVKDEEGYPSKYITRVIKPTRLTFTCHGRPEVIVVREPFGKAAAKVDLPIGWYMQ